MKQKAENAWKWMNNNADITKPEWIFVLVSLVLPLISPFVSLANFYLPILVYSKIKTMFLFVFICK